MSLLFFRLSILYIFCAVVGGLSVNPDNINGLRQREPSKLNSKPFFSSTEKASPTYRKIGTTRFQKRLRNTTKSGVFKKVNGARLRTKAGRIASQELSILRKNDTETSSTTKYPKRLSSQKTLNKTDQNIIRKVMRKNKSRSGNGTRVKATRKDLIKIQRKPIGVRKEQRVKVKRKKKERIINDVSKNMSEMDFPINTENSRPVPERTDNSMLRYYEHVSLKAPCRTTSLNESSLSLRSLFHVPRVHKVSDCSSRKHRIIGEQRHEEDGQSSAVPIRSFDRGHTELINEYESERSMDIVGVEYVHPEGHILSPSFVSRRVNLGRLMTKNEESTPRVVSTHPQKIRGLRSEVDKSSSIPVDAVTANRTIDIETDKNDYDYASLKKKRQTDYTMVDYRRALSKAQQTKESIIGPHVTLQENLPKNPNVDSAEDIRSETERPASRVQNSTSQLLIGLRNIDDRDTTDIPWPLVPGPISCDLDFQLKPSFVAKLGEFDYVVSVQRQQNPDIPADHACTGVVYNPRFVMIAPHCLHDFCDNYGLTVTSTDDLCTIDEIIEVDYVIEHENYDVETRKNDIALIKLKSEIHKKPATFPKEDGALGKLFYAVGFGELMWKSYPTRISKLLQKMPVQRYSHVVKEAPGTLDITTSNLDLTGAFRGDFGGALISPRGEFVGLKSKIVKKSMEYEVYTRVRTYLPWIESMVALHGSW